MSEDLLDIISQSLKLLGFISLSVVTMIQIDYIKEKYKIFDSKGLLTISLIIMWLAGGSSIFVDTYINNRDQRVIRDSQLAIIDSQKKAEEVQRQIHYSDDLEANKRHKRDSIYYTYQTNGIKDSVRLLRNIVNDNEKMERNANINELLLTANDLNSEYIKFSSSSPTQYDTSDVAEIKKINYFSKMKIILDRALKNSFLSANPKLQGEWGGMEVGVNLYVNWKQEKVMPSYVLQQNFIQLNEEIPQFIQRVNYNCFKALNPNFPHPLHKTEKK